MFGSIYSWPGAHVKVFEASVSCTLPSAHTMQQDIMLEQSPQQKNYAQIGIHTCTRSRQTTLAATHRLPRQGTDFWKEHVSVIQLQSSIIIAIFYIWKHIQ